MNRLPEYTDFFRFVLAKVLGFLCHVFEVVYFLEGVLEGNVEVVGLLVQKIYVVLLRLKLFQQLLHPFRGNMIFCCLLLKLQLTFNS
jgi:hypothetical protein